MRRVRLVLLSIALGALPPVPLASRCLSAPPDQSTVLGTALVIPQATATFATVYARRVSRMARETKTDFAMLLGRVAAHELGHLLMNTAGHPAHGLMRPTWTKHEVGRNHAADWAFTRADMAAMRQPGP